MSRPGRDHGPRDRDTEGRPVNARPRDRLGRLLTPGAVDERVALPPVPPAAADVVALAQRLLDGGHPFEAHEVFEEQWKRTTDPARELWRALAQLCVAHTHQLRGNSAGVRALARRSREGLAGVPAGATEGVDVTGLIAYARRLEVAEPAASPDPPRLTGLTG